MAVTVAVRTTESLGVTAASEGINWDFDLVHFGPFHNGIPIGPVVVPSLWPGGSLWPGLGEVVCSFVA